MIQDALEGKIDLILVKSISRFSRNLVECQSYAAQLKDKGVEVRFEREGISSFDPTSGFIFSLLSAVAQDESRSISENIKWGYQKRFERGEYRLGSNRILGYDADPITKKLVPNRDAWIVRLAFERFVQGVPYQKIAAELNAKGAKRLRGQTPLSVSAIQHMVSNETYAGDKLLRKTHRWISSPGSPTQTRGMRATIFETIMRPSLTARCGKRRRPFSSNAGRKRRAA